MVKLKLWTTSWHQRYLKSARARVRVCVWRMGGCMLGCPWGLCGAIAQLCGPHPQVCRENLDGVLRHLGYFDVQCQAGVVFLRYCVMPRGESRVVTMGEGVVSQQVSCMGPMRRILRAWCCLGFVSFFCAPRYRNVCAVVLKRMFADYGEKVERVHHRRRDALRPCVCDRRGTRS